MKYLFRLILVTAAFTVAVPAMAMAASSPTTAPPQVLFESFESTPSSNYVVGPITMQSNPGVGAAYWGYITQRRVSGSQGLWCSGSRLTPSAWPFYVDGSAGVATFTVTQTSDLYQSFLSFYYTMPTLGASDANSFAVQLRQAGVPSDTDARYPFDRTSVGAFSRVQYDLTQSSVTLSRRAAAIRFQWFDFDEGGLMPRVAEGVTIDDVSVTGWRFGPVRSLSVTGSAGEADLKWSRPYGAVGVSIEDTRSVRYRVWRAPFGTSGWTELTASGAINDAASLVSFTDTSAPEGAFTWAVQSTDESGTQFGAPVYVSAVLAGPPQVSISQPTTGTLLSNATTATVSGQAAAATSATVASVRLSIRRQSDGQYWNGSAWQAGSVTVAASSSDAFANWQYGWRLPAERTAATYTVGARATDSRGASSATQTVVVTVDTEGPRAVRARSVNGYTVDVTFDQPVAPATVSRTAFTIAGLRIGSARLIGDRTVRLSTGAQRPGYRYVVTVQPATLTDLLGNTGVAPRSTGPGVQRLGFMGR